VSKTGGVGIEIVKAFMEGIITYSYYR